MWIAVGGLLLFRAGTMVGTADAELMFGPAVFSAGLLTPQWVNWRHLCELSVAGGSEITDSSATIERRCEMRFVTVLPVVLVMATPVLGQSRNPQQLRITNATIDSTTIDQQLTINGEHFDGGTGPFVVSVDTVLLAVVGPVTPTQVTTVLPTGTFAPGSYTLMVAKGRRRRDVDDFTLTIGASDLACAGCVSSVEVDFAFAESDVPNGTALRALEADVANDLMCVGCVSSDEVDPTFADDDWEVSGNNMSSTVTGTVGIGTTTPRDDAKLDVAGHARAGSLTVDDFINSNGAVSAWGLGGQGWLGLVHADATGTQEWRLDIGRDSAGDFSIATFPEPTTPFSIRRSTGTVGIGTTAPRDDAKLDVARSRESGVADGG